MFHVSPGRSAYGMAAVLVAAAASAPALGASVTQIVTYQSTVTEDANGALDLKAELNYDNARPDAPIAVLMHAYSGSTGHFSSYRTQAQRLRDAGFFTVSVAMRGREGSDGQRDSGGVEIHDIYDAVEQVKRDYAPLVDGSNVHITGYSGGGGNVMSAVTKFPDYFRAASSFFGISDYGHDPVNGWYQYGSGTGHKATLRADIGDPTSGDAAVLDRYLARASNRAAINNPYTDIHLFVNADETLCPPIQHQSYKGYAVADAAYAGEFDNITVHTGVPGTYHDFDGDGVNDPDEEQAWPHSAPTANQQAAAERWYRDRLLSGAIAQPTLNAADSLFVAGFVKTGPFDLWLGDGQNAAGMLDYALGDTSLSFTLEIETSDKAALGELAVDVSAFAGQWLDAFVNDLRIDTFVAAERYTYALGDGDTLRLAVIPEPGSLVLVAGLGLLGRRRRRA